MEGQKVKCMVYEEAVRSNTASGGIWNSNKNQMNEKDKHMQMALTLDKKEHFQLM